MTAAVARVLLLQQEKKVFTPSFPTLKLGLLTMAVLAGVVHENAVSESAVSRLRGKNKTQSETGGTIAR